MHRQLLLTGSILGLGVVALTLPRTRPILSRIRGNATSSRPNVVLISVDTTRADHLGCYGYGRPTSPNLDRLAAGGVRFANARSQAPWTLPSHMALFTSLLPSHCRMDQPICALSPDIPTLAEVLHNNGYHTAGLVNDGYMQAFFGNARGYEHWREFSAQSPAGRGDHLTDKALDWLATAPAEPFFLFLHYYDPHSPYEAPEQFAHLFGATLTSAQTAALVERYQSNPGTPLSRDRLDQLIAAYDAEIAFVDHQLGRLFASLPENTLLVVCSDHGEAFNEHGLMAHGAFLYDEVLRVPLLMSFPGVLPAGRVVNDPAMLIDVAPTILQLCGLPAPAHCEGLDLGPTWSGARLPERSVLAEVVGNDCMLKTVVRNDWKLIRSVINGREELYHLPDEHTDLSQQEAGLRNELATIVQQWMDEEDYWVLHAVGPGDFQVNVVPQGGQLLHVVAGHAHRADAHCEHGPHGKSLAWVCRPSARPLRLFLQNAPVDSKLDFDVLFDGRRQPARVFAGPSKAHPPRLPCDMNVLGAETDDDSILGPSFRADEPGVHVFHHRARHVSPFAPALGAIPDDAIVRRLKSLGYLR
jgi:arylsulfatase A-like enzyme